MNIGSVKLVYFSPTGTTKQIVEEIARGINHDFVERIDIGKPDGMDRVLGTRENELMIVGAPVYFGRVQKNALERLNGIQGRNTPTVCVVVYGNREYDDALLEMEDFMVNHGCIPIACGAYIGEHSFSRRDAPIAAGRPDSDDLAHAWSFGEKIRQKAALASSLSLGDAVSVPGRYPYIEMEGSRKNFSDVDLVSVDDTCLHCGDCARICPVGAINDERSDSVDSRKCIVCHACVRYCPASARRVKNDTIEAIARRLSDALRERKEPEWFL